MMARRQQPVDTVPKVTFLVPCYRLAEWLPECLESILSQTYRDYEVLVMDDCSPDETPSVVASFSDPRIRYVRNETNLGHLRNYNKGITLARGEYLWILSADDLLRRNYILERFAAVLDRHADVSYVFCPGMKLQNGHEVSQIGYHGERDRIFATAEYLEKALNCNCVPTPAAMARKSCYDRAGGFPPDLPHTGDWYLWCHFALQGSVAYVAEPMASYRLHERNMTKSYLSHAEALIANELGVRWRMKTEATRLGRTDVVALCVAALADDYSSRVVRKIEENWIFGMTTEEFENSLKGSPLERDEAATIRARVYAALGDAHHDRGELGGARRSYEMALAADAWHLRTWSKYALLRAGPLGREVRKAVSTVRAIGALTITPAPKP